jgi:hypothetical protein
MCLWVSYKKKKKKKFASLNSLKKGVGSGARSGSICQRYESGNPDPHQNVTDPQHCFIPNCKTAVFRTLSKHGSPRTPQGDGGLETAGGVLRRARFEPQHPRHAPGGPRSILQVQPPTGNAQGRTLPGGLLQGEESDHGTKIRYETYNEECVNAVLWIQIDINAAPDPAF